jgi:hypothetical protein
LIHELRAAVGDMDSDGHAQPARFLIDRIEIGFDEMLVIFKRPETDGHRAIFSREADLLQRFTNRHSGYNTRPTETILSLLPDVCHPTVPRPAQGDFRLGFVGHPRDPHGVEENLHVDAERVHML